jgi:hypothetical protein
MDATIKQELLSVIKDLSLREAQLVIEYARTLHSMPISEVGRAYLDTLAESGASPTELLRAARAVQRVEDRLAQQDPQTALYDLEQRTEDRMRSWFRERDLDYKAVAEEQFDEIVDEIIHRHRKTK